MAERESGDQTRSEKVAFSSEQSVVYFVGAPSSFKPVSRSNSHGGFDNDEDTLHSTLRIIRGTNKLDRKF